MKIKGRTRAVALITTAVLTVPVATHAMQLTLATYLNPTHIFSTAGVEPLMECIQSGSDGEIEIAYYPSGQILSPKSAIEGVTSGIADLGMISAAYTSNKIPLNGMTLLPDMGGSSVEMVTAYRKSLEPGMPLYEELAAADLVPILVNLLPVYQLATSTGPVMKISDMHGLKLRSAGGAQSFMVTSLGATPIEMPGADMYVAIQRGTMDGTFSALGSVTSWSLNEVVNAVSTNGAFGSGHTLIAASSDTWNALTDDERALISECGLKTEMELAESLDAQNTELVERFKEQGITVYEFPPEVSDAMIEAMKPVAEDYLQRLENIGIDAQGPFNAYRAMLQSQ